MDEITNTTEAQPKKAAWRFHRWLELLEAHANNHHTKKHQATEQPPVDARFEDVEEQPE